jgi:hypothetical protein
VKLWVKLTIDGMVRALRAKAHDVADRIEVEGGRSAIRKPDVPKRRQEKTDAVRS